MNADVEILLIASVTAAACALPGVFLVLRRMALLSDAISHAVLPGIVIMFFLVKDLDSPLLIFGAVVMGMITVVLTELLEKTGLIKEDAAIGAVFPVLFSIGVILVARHAGNVHLDTDAVLLGELAYAPMDRMVIGGIDIGPSALVVMSVILVVNALVFVLFYKELKLATFDPGLAAALGLSPILVQQGLMLATSVTVVGAFNSVGSILVVALMIAPPAAAYLITDRLSVMVFISVGIGVISAAAGYWMANLLDISIAGAMATACGVVFFFVFLFAPHRGMVQLFLRRRRQRWEFAVRMLLVHLYHHEGSETEQEENRAEHLSKHIAWTSAFAESVVNRADARKLIRAENNLLILTDNGRREAVRTMEGQH